MKERLTSRRIAQLIIVLAILLALVAYRTWFDGAAMSVGAAKNDQICDLSRSACRTVIDSTPLSISVAELPVRAEHEFVIRLHGDALAPKPVKAWLEGRDMFMGTIPVDFKPQKDGWQAATQVGSCSSTVMVWLLNIEWSNGQRQKWALPVGR